MYSADRDSLLRSGTVPLPPARRLQSTCPPVPLSHPRSQPTHSHKISLPATHEDPMLFGQVSQREIPKCNDATSPGPSSVSRHVASASTPSTQKQKPTDMPDAASRGSESLNGTRKQLLGVEGVREPPATLVQQESSDSTDWVHKLRIALDESEKSSDAPQGIPTTPYTVSTSSSRSSYSSRPFQTHSRDVSSLASLPSSQLPRAIASSCSIPAETRPLNKIVRPRSSSLSYSRVRTPSNGSTASSASSDFPITPAIPNPTSQRIGSVTKKDKVRDKARTDGEDWLYGMPVLGGHHNPTGKGPSMVDPRFHFPRRSQALGKVSVPTGGAAPLDINSNVSSASFGKFGETQRRSNEDKANCLDRSFIASLNSKPFLDPTGHELPVFSSTPLTLGQTAYHPISPLGPAFHPPSPFSPTSPVASLKEAPQRTTIANFSPHFVSLESPKSTRKTSTARSKRRSTSFSRRMRRHSSPRKTPGHRRTSSSSSPHRRAISRSSSGRFDHGSPLWTRTLRHRSRSAPDLRAHARSQSVPTPIPFDTFSPRSPYVQEPGSRRRPSIADELLFGDASRRLRERQSSLDGSEPIVFPSRKGSTSAQKGKGKEGNRSRSVPLAPRVQQASPNLPLRRLPGSPHISEKQKVGKSIPAVKARSLMLPHPKIVVPARGGGSTSASSGEDSIAAIQRRYREGEAGRETTSARFDTSERTRSLEDDQVSIDHSSLLRVLRENEESRKERETWSDSATKTLGLGLGLGPKVAAFERRKGMRGPANIAFGGMRGEGRSKVKHDRQQARKQVEKEKRRAADSGTDGEGRTDFARHTRRDIDSSPPMPHSFEPFTQLTRKLSLTKAKSRDATIKDVQVKEARQKITMDTEATMSPRTIRGQPIRHLRTSPSVDSIYSRSGPPVPLVYRNGSATQFGQAVSLEDNATLNEGYRRPSLPNQNAFLSLPPHLHHLLRSPERESYEPSRPPPPLPSSQVFHVQDSNRLSTSSVASAAQLSLALESHLSQILPSSDAPKLAQTVGKENPQIVHALLDRSASNPTLLSEPSPRSSPERRLLPIQNGSPARPAGAGHPLSPLPEAESPDSQKSAATGSDASARLSVDNKNEWKELFFSPPRRQGGMVQSLSDPTVSIQVASDDETSTEGTDDTFSIHRLERTRKSLEALFAPASPPAVHENAQETLLLPPSISRSTSHLSSAQGSFVTAQETTLDERATTPRLDTSRPLATPTQTPWASTSFAREYLEDRGVSNRYSDPTSLSSKRASSRISHHSFIDFEADDDDTMPGSTPEAVEPSKSPLSFLDDFSPPPSIPASPTIDSFPSTNAPSSRPAAPSSEPLQPDSLPTSPTFSSAFTEEDSSRFSRFFPNRESYLSVDSQNLRISPTAAKFANGGEGGTPRTGYNSSRSNVLNSFPVPPVEEADENGSQGHSQLAIYETEDDRIKALQVDAKEEESSLPSPSLRHQSSESDIAGSPEISVTRHSHCRKVYQPDSNATNQSFLDVFDPSDNESKRWSRGTFQTFYSGSNPNETVPPLPSFRH